MRVCVRVRVRASVCDSAGEKATSDLTHAHKHTHMYTHTHTHARASSPPTDLGPQGPRAKKAKPESVVAGPQVLWPFWSEGSGTQDIYSESRIVIALPIFFWQLLLGNVVGFSF